MSGPVASEGLEEAGYDGTVAACGSSLLLHLLTCRLVAAAGAVDATEPRGRGCLFGCTVARSSVSEGWATTGPRGRGRLFGFTEARSSGTGIWTTTLPVRRGTVTASGRTSQDGSHVS